MERDQPERPESTSSASDKKPAASPKMSFPFALSRFLTNIDSLAGTLPLALAAIEAAQKTSADTFKTFIDQNAVIEGRDGEPKVMIPPDRWLRFNKLVGRRRKFAMASRTVPSSFLVSLVSQFDAFVGDVIRVLFDVKPETLNVSEKALTFGQLLEFTTLDDARAFVVEKEVEGILRKSHADQFDWLEGKFGLPLRKGLESWPAFVEITERRHLLVHTGGVISSQYLTVCKAHKATVAKDAAVGKALKVSQKYFDSSYERLFEIGVKLVHVVWRKLLPDERADADANLARICYELLEDERYDLARQLLDFATCVLKQHVNDEVRRRFVINRAQAYKWLGHQEKALEIVAAEDWSASADIFKLADAVIRDEFEKAAKLVERVGKSAQKSDYRDWPLFREFRKTEFFLRAYEKAFGEAFNVADLADVAGQPTERASEAG